MTEKSNIILCRFFGEYPMFHSSNAVDNVAEVEDSKMQLHELY